MDRRMLLAGLPLAYLGGRAHAQGGGAPGATDYPSFDTVRLEPADFSRLHQAMRPPAEKWRAIPWETDLAAARRRSVEEKKPLLL
ncbi:MAG: hypothetical protein FJX77_09425, partial [Armatimonadetes bacterium]|nr:hypothetical protein [Armatimonadota bacterium]